MSDNPPQPAKWVPLAAIAAALTVWGLLLAIGAALRLSSDDGATDPRKFWIVIGASGAFLAVWGVALVARRRRLSRRAEPSPPAD